jgi:hypothetical protein
VLEDQLITAVAVGLKAEWAEGVLKEHGPSVLLRSVEVVRLGLPPTFVELALWVDTLVVELCAALQARKFGKPIDLTTRRLLAEAIASCRQPH